MKNEFLGITLLSLLLASTAQAQLEVAGDKLDDCSEIAPLKNAGNFSEARDKARLCLEGLEQELSSAVSELFSQQIGQWNRTNFDQTQAMGFNSITARYEKNGIRVNVSLTGAAGGGSGSTGGLGGLSSLISGLAQSSALQGGKSITVAGLPSSVQPDGTITVPLEDGSLLTFESNEFDNADEALSGMGDLVNDFPVAGINAALL